MIKGYLGDVCFNGKLLKNHIVYTDSNRRVERIVPFACECEGIILCDGILFIVKEELDNSPEKITKFKEEYNHSKSYSIFFKSSSYRKYGATDIKRATFIEMDNTKPFSIEKENSRSIKESKSYKSVVVISKIMDRYYLDPIIGIFPIVGDIIPPLCSIPSIYVAMLKVKSLPLTLAIIYNILFDVAVGMIPFFIGNIIDFYNKAYVRNLKLIIGFVDNDKKIINEVNRKALLFTILIAVVIIACLYLVKLAIYSAIIIKEYIASLF